MSERNIIDQLDDAVASLTEERQPDLKNFGSELSALAAVAQELIGLPRDSFKTELRQQLIRSTSMSGNANNAHFENPRLCASISGNFQSKGEIAINQ